MDYEKVKLIGHYLAGLADHGNADANLVVLDDAYELVSAVFEETVEQVDIDALSFEDIRGAGDLLCAAADAKYGAYIIRDLLSAALSIIAFVMAQEEERLGGGDER